MTTEERIERLEHGMALLALHAGGIRENHELHGLLARILFEHIEAQSHSPETWRAQQAQQLANQSGSMDGLYRTGGSVRMINGERV